MKMILMAIPLLAFGSCASTGGDPDAPVRYVCHCGPDCDCKTVSNEPGKCACGEYLVPE